MKSHRQIGNFYGQFPDPEFCRLIGSVRVDLSQKKDKLPFFPDPVVFSENNIKKG